MAARSLNSSGPVLRTRALTIVAPLVVAVLLTGCSQSKQKSVAPPAPATPSSSSAAPTPSVKTVPRATASPTLGGQCDDLLPVTVVDEALGRPVIGNTSFIRGIAEPNIGRLTYLNCRYGIPRAVKGKPAPVAQLEIGVSLYQSAARAASRLQGTIDDYRGHGASPQSLSVGATQATVLTGYGQPTLVLAAGPRTVAITIDAKLLRTAAQATWQTLAQTVLSATSAFDGVAGVTATPSPTGSAADGSSAGASDSATGSASPSSSSS